MLDRVDAGADRGVDPRRAMGVGGDPQAPLMRLLGDRPKLGFGELLLAGLGVAREDAAGGADLDHLGAAHALLADPVPELLRPVSDARRRDMIAGRQEGFVAMAAGRGERVRGRHDPRPRDPALVDRLHIGDVGMIGGADVAHRGEARLERGAGMARPHHGLEQIGERSNS